MSAWPEGFTPPRIQTLRRSPEDGTLSLTTSEGDHNDFPDPRELIPRGHVIQVCAVAMTYEELASPPARAETHMIPGNDFSGYVLSSPIHSPFKPGTQVYGRTSSKRPGNARSYSLATFPELGIKPKNLSWEMAATVPTAGLTAFQALFEKLKFIEPREWSPKWKCPHNGSRRLLVTGGDSTIGIWAIQLARLGFVGHIVATCAPGNVDFVKSLGAHEVLDISSPEGDLRRWPASRAKFDAVLDCVGGPGLLILWPLVRAYCSLVSVVVTPGRYPGPITDLEPGIRGGYFTLKSDSYQLEQLTAILQIGLVRTVCEQVYPLEDFQKALDMARSQDRSRRGNVVLTMKREDPRRLIALLEEHGRLDDRDALERELERRELAAPEDDEDDALDFDGEDDEEEDDEDESDGQGDLDMDLDGYDGDDDGEEMNYDETEDHGGEVLVQHRFKQPELDDRRQLGTA